MESNKAKKLPHWFRKKPPQGQVYHQVSDLLKQMDLNTVCKEAQCPNIAECYGKGTATFMILGDICTRNCRFCAIPIKRPRQVDLEEPQRLKKAVQTLSLAHVVITMVSRDDLEDEGAEHVANVLNELNTIPSLTIEVLTSDFSGRKTCLKTVLNASPHVFNHNIETTEQLHNTVRPMMSYRRSLDVLDFSKKYRPDIFVKSGFMVGLGESEKDVLTMLHDLKEVGCDIVTIGQYLRPPNSSLEVQDYITPEQFQYYEEIATQMGFLHVVSSPFARSSYQAEAIFEKVKKKERNLVS